MNKRLLGVLIAVLAVAGCSKGSSDDTSSQIKTKAPVVAAAEAVAAVLVSGPPVAKLGFVLAAKPVVGVQVDLRLDLTATEAVPALQLRAEADGITIDPATAQIGLAIEAGKTASHQLSLTPDKEGLNELTVRYRTAPDSAETVYSIPVLVAAAGG
jgi:hypothetical protein